MKIIEKDLTKLSTIRVKSCAKYYCEPANINDIKQSIEFSSKNNLGIEVLGNGSNIFVFKRDLRKNYFKIKGRI